MSQQLGLARPQRLQISGPRHILKCSKKAVWTSECLPFIKGVCHFQSNFILIRVAMVALIEGLGLAKWL